ncbi:M4 family metallopeptidase [Candidatus Uabimicrobium sp. HlEnr_7]|uniref:M4 family metallopeptidase n=1 Tax=Candidatus Uabimicrobium helgolandensis TaxID=3095367 RepID=UPI003559263F
MSNKLIVLFTILTVAMSWTMAADIVDLTQAEAQLEQMKQMRASSHEAMLQSAFGMSPEMSLELVRKTSDRSGQTHHRYKMLHNGVPVWGQQVVITEAGRGVVRLHGNLVTGIETDMNTRVKPSFDAATALEMMKNAQRSSSNVRNASWKYENETSEMVVYVDEADSKAKLSYAVSFFADVENGGAPTRPYYLVDATDKDNVLLQFEGLTTDRIGKGPGGNNKTGQIQYDPNSKFGAMDVQFANGRSTMTNKDVKTVDMKNSSWGGNTHSFDGTTNTHKSINGAFCPLNDAHYFGGVVFNMYKEWYNTAPLTFQLTMRVHYSSNYENAFWNGTSMTFGDGRNRFYPLVSLDVSAHEVSHGVTEQNSGLVYRNQSGGINEAFSDIAGEASEYFMNGSNDWQVGADIFKSAGALRYMDNPPKDGRSIGHASDYRNGMDVHYSSGVFNKAFYLLATDKGWGTRKAFDIFMKANQNYWTPSTNYAQGAKGCMDAARDLGYSVADVQAVFAAVGVSAE